MFCNLHQVCVRVVKGDRYSEWSSKFSLKTLGSEGIFSCLFKDSAEELQVVRTTYESFELEESYFPSDWNQSGLISVRHHQNYHPLSILYDQQHNKSTSLSSYLIQLNATDVCTCN